MSRWKLALVMTACGLAAACGKGGEAASHGGKAASASAGGCGAYHAGSGGVIRTFCDGPAKVTFTLAGQTHTMTGGTCEAAPVFNLNVGVVTNSDAPKPEPDYFGVTKLGPGDTLGQGDVIAVRVGGKSYLFGDKSGPAGMKGGHITAEGREVGGDKAPVKLEADYSC